jgi:protein-disulfide isomerase
VPFASGNSASPYNILGREDAPVIMIEFGDLQCGYCARHATYTLPELRRRYIDTGKLRYTARDLPLPIHPYAVAAAAAARCAGEQGKFWDYRDALFAVRGRLGTEPYAQIARDLGLDAERLEACRRDGRHEAAIREDVRVAQANGIVSTPSFVIGRKVDGRLLAETVTGAKPIEVFVEKIEALLSEPD